MSSSSIYPHELTGRTIRLLTVEPDEPSAPLRCQLSETCLDTNPTPYHALSYCWGANQNPVQITCNSHPLQVTPNLHSALHEYRRRGTQALLWVDAICINQSDTSERTSQVRMMDKIYTEADCVVVWLGEAQATDTLALELLKEMHAPWATSDDIPILENGKDALSHDAMLAKRMPQPYFDALAAFLLRPWFSRMWIIQEFLLARRVTIWCGTSTIGEDFPVLEATARWLQMTNCILRTQFAVKAFEDPEARQMGKLKLPCASVLWSIKHSREKEMNGMHDMHSIFTLMTMTRWFGAKDPRDRIFALVGLSNEIDKTFVDYNKSYEDISQEVSHMLLDGMIQPTMGCVLDILSCITRGKDDDIRDPSWVVGLFNAQDFHYAPMNTGYPSVDSVMKQKPEIHFSMREDKEVLHIRGIVFDKITHLVSFPDFGGQVELPFDDNSMHKFAAYRDWSVRASNLLVPPGSTEPSPIYEPTGEYTSEAFWRTLCCNRSVQDAVELPADRSGYDAFALYSYIHVRRHRYRNLKYWFLGLVIACVSALMYYFRSNWFSSSTVLLILPLLAHYGYRTCEGLLDSVQADLQLKLRDFESNHFAWMQGRQFGRTELGMVGLLPISAKVGNCIAVFKGCRVPFVLVKSEKGYRIVGDAYLHGAMNGERQESEGEMLRIL